MTRVRTLARTAAWLALAALAPSPAIATVTFVGPTSPASPPGSGDSESTLEIGFGSNPNAVDPRATVQVNGGSTLEFDEVYVGSDEGFFGRMLISGDGSLVGDGTRMIVEESGSSSEPALQVGREGDGYLLVEGGAWLDIQDPNADLSVGDQTTGVGRVVVRDPFTLVTIGESLVVGQAGQGRVDILSGALVRTEDETSAGVFIGAGAGSVGEVLVDGVGTRLQVGDDLVVGGSGAGRLTISNQAIVDVANSSGPVATVGAEGRLTLDGGTLRAGALTVNGVLGGSGVVRGNSSGAAVTINAAGRVDVGAGDLLTFDDSVSNQGTIGVDGGEVEFLEGFTNNAIGALAAPGRVTLQSGRVRLTSPLTNSGAIAATEGASDLHGEVTNAAGGSIVVARDSVLTFHDDFTDSGGTVNVLAGGNALFLTDATFQAASTLAIGLDGDPLSAGGSPIEIAGAATLDGALDVTLPSDFVGTPGDTFTLLQAADGISGSFATTSLPALPGGLEFGLLTTPNDLSLEVRIATVGTLEGDFNGDGVVDAADYTVWREGVDVLPTQANYDLWAGNLGATASSLSRAVPEPGALSVLAAGLACLAARRRAV